ncbi:MAG TPA: Bax inhibitor-1/YccA family protein [Actinomycetota bacterium]
MSTQILNDLTFTPAKVEPFAAERATPQAMTYGGVIVRALFFLILTVATATAGWNAAADARPQSGLWFWLGYMLLIALTFAAANNPRIAAVAGIVYALLMGFWMGSISRLYDAYYDGIVLQAILASLATFLACLALYSLRVIRVTGRFVKILVIGMVGLMLLYLTAFFFSLFGIDLYFWTNPTPVGIGISLLICALAAMSLIADFAVIESGVKAGAPAAMSWFCAYGLLTTLVWLYLEILRLLAILRRASG